MGDGGISNHMICFDCVAMCICYFVVSLYLKWFGLYWCVRVSVIICDLICWNHRCDMHWWSGVILHRALFFASSLFGWVFFEWISLRFFEVWQAFLVGMSWFVCGAAAGCEANLVCGVMHILFVLFAFWNLDVMCSSFVWFCAT